MTPAELAALPTSGPAWRAMKEVADADLGPPDIADLDGNHDVRTLAVALVYARTGDASYRRKAADAIMSAIGSEDGGLVLELGRNLAAYVVAADLIDLETYDRAKDARFREWLAGLRTEAFSDGTLISNDEGRANNHGRVAGGSRIAIDAYLGDVGDAARAAQVFKGWLGDRSAHVFPFKYDLSWQADAAKPVAVNPLGATKDGHSIDGAQPEEMRRGCAFRWPPCLTTYPWGGLQGALVEAQILSRLGYDVWNWENRALLRAVDFLDRLERQFGGWWATGRYAWQPWLVNHVYGTAYPTSPAGIGRTFGWTDWLYPAGGGTANRPPTCTDLALETTQGAPAEVDASCSDPDTGDVLAYEIASHPAKGTASVVGGRLRYIPAAGATGSDSFRYRASDGLASSNAATVAVTITAGGVGGGIVTFVPNGDGTRGAAVTDKAGTTVDLFASIDEPAEDSDDGRTYVRNDDGTSGTYLALLTEVPADFGSLASLAISVRARTLGRVDDTTRLYARVYARDESTPLTDEVVVAVNPGQALWATISQVTFSGVHAGGRRVWNGARLRLRWRHVAVRDADPTHVRVSAVELRGTYKRAHK